MRRPFAVALALACLLASGCGLVTLTHDEMLGPLSPLGRIHEVTVGSGFRVTETGPVAELGGEPLLRPYPRDIVQRIGSPHSFYTLVQGVEAFLAGFSPAVRRQHRIGADLSAQQRAELLPGLAAGDVLELLGPPELWIRRRDSSLMAYRAGVSRSLSLYLGVPPVVAAMLPFPGAANLQLRYVIRTSRPHKTLLFFDADDRLRRVVADAEAGELEP